MRSTTQVLSRNTEQNNNLMKLTEVISHSLLLSVLSTFVIYYFTRVIKNVDTDSNACFSLITLFPAIVQYFIMFKLSNSFEYAVLASYISVSVSVTLKFMEDSYLRFKIYDL